MAGIFNGSFSTWIRMVCYIKPADWAGHLTVQLKPIKVIKLTLLSKNLGKRSINTTGNVTPQSKRHKFH